MDNFFTNIRNKFVQNWKAKAAETDIDGNIYYWLWLNEACKTFYSGNHIDKFSNSNAYRLAGSLSEIFFPIDAIADRIASLNFDIINENGELKEPPKNIKRLIEEPNMFSTFSENMYNAVFNELSDGNNYIYTKTPKSFTNISPDTISSVWVLQPDKVDIQVRNTRPNYFEASKKSELINYYSYSKYDDEKLNPDYVIHERSVNIGDYSCGMKSPSPLNAACKNINNLLAVYEARYKVFASNGCAGIITPDPGVKRNGDVEAIDPIKRDAIVQDIMSRNGLIGDKQFLSASGIALKLVKTVATIAELQPFEETQADALQIAGIIGVDKDLIPMKEGTTFTNKTQAEKNLYQNVIIGIANDKSKSFTKAYGLDKIGLRFVPNFDEVAVLQEDKEISYRSDGVLLDNIIKMKNSGLINEQDSTNIINKMTEKYKNE